MTSLGELPSGKTATIRSVGGEGALRQHFLDMGLIPKGDVTMVKYAPMGDPMELRIHSYELTLRLADAEKIEIEPIEQRRLVYKGINREQNIDHPGLGEGGKYHSKKDEKPLDDDVVLTYALVGNLSGGNQQKVVVGNWLNNDPKIMIYDEPTRGIDVNAKQQIFEIMWNQAKQGNSSIFVSTELEELPGVCNRILVLRGGRITEELTTEKIDSMTTNDLYTLCMGGHSSEREN